MNTHIQKFEFQGEIIFLRPVYTRHMVSLIDREDGDWIISLSLRPVDSSDPEFPDQYSISILKRHDRGQRVQSCIRQVPHACTPLALRKDYFRQALHGFKYEDAHMHDTDLSVPFSEWMRTRYKDLHKVCNVYEDHFVDTLALDSFYRYQ